jgi:hypothetical protein
LVLMRRELVNHDVGNPTGFTALKPKSASSFGNAIGHHQIVSIGRASDRRLFVARSPAAVDYSSATAAAPGIRPGGEKSAAPGG